MQVLGKIDKNRRQDKVVLGSHIDHVDHVVLVAGCDVAGGLVDHVHQDCGQVGGQENNVELLSSSRMGEIFL